MKRWTYFLFAVVALAVIGGAGYWGYRSQQTAVPLTPELHKLTRFHSHLLISTIRCGLLITLHNLPIL